MKKLHLFAFYAMVTPAIALGAGSVLAQQSTGQGLERGQESSQSQPGTSQSRPGSGSSQGDVGASRPGQSGSQAADDRRRMGDQAHMQSRGNIDSVPAGGMQASNLIGANVKTTSGEDVGSVDDLIVDENGQILAIVVGVGGFLGMGQRDIAIGWDNVHLSGTDGDQELRIDMSREQLRSAPKFNKRD